MADQEPLDTTSQDDDHLPERIRVHALAKRLGVTSKRILAKLSELGTEARSPQSSVDRAVAESVRESLTAPPALAPAEPSLFDPTGTTAGPDAAAAVEPDAAPAPTAREPEPIPATQPADDSGQTPGITVAPDPVVANAASETAEPQSSVTPAVAAPTGAAADTGDSAATPVAEPSSSSAAAGDASATAVPASAEIAPASASAAPAAAVTPPPAFTAAFNLFASPVPEEPASTEPHVFESAVVAAPLFLSPDAAAAEQPRRRRKPEPEPEPESGADAESDTDTDSEDQSEQGDSDDQPRRRRRGRRGRGRGRGEQQSEGEDTDTEGGASADSDEQSADTGEKAADSGESEESGAADAADSDGGEDSESGASRRRRRRRRRKVGGESGENEPADDDPPNTVVHEREPRTKARTRATVDEVQGITGSTRLEAKRQRRRDGREAGRRRPPILTESEFLARREAVDRVMVVREKEFPGHPAATQVAVLEDNILVEHFVTSTGSASMVGNVYLGKVQNVLPSMEAAFVDIGRGRNGVLYAGEVNWEAAGLGGRERKIEQALKPGDQVLVQVSKDPVGHKGARLTTQISLAGRFLVYVPGGTSTGISRKLPDTERKRLKEILREIVPADAGVIIRTASEGVSEAELTRDVDRLQTAWRKITAAAENESGAPKTLYEEPDLLVKVVRDLFNEDFSKLVIEGERSWNTVENYIGTVAPDLLARVSRHESAGADVFETYRIDEQLAKALDRKVWLPSGGTLVIDRTEAMTVVDVNTGKFTGSGGGNLEETVTRNNLEAAEEIVRQMRLRDIGGMIVVDFIDMVLESNRDLVLRRLTEALGRDRTRHQVSEVTSLGLVQMTRKKLGTGLVEAFSTTCEHCHGRGILVHSYPVEPSGSDEGAGRGRESGSRRRRNRDKPAATAPAAPQQAAAPELSEEEAAAKRAHPVALAMAAHHPEAEEAEQAEAAPAEASKRDSGQKVSRGEAGGAESAAAPADATAAASGAEKDTAAVAEPRRRRARVRRSAGAAGQAAPVAERNGRGTSGDTEPVAAESATAEPAAGESVPAEPAATGDRSGTPAAEPEIPVAVASGPDDAATAAAEPGPAADRNGLAHAANGTAHPAEPAVESVPAATPEPTGDGVPEARSRRRRVARSTSAPAADSAGAVFVLATDDQEAAAPVADFVADPPEPEVPVRRVRRRAAARPSGPPVDDQN
ncbi:translation initiation factor IF-2 N-terminal domain-containing protein [Nocardia sp. NPDC003963]